MKRKNLVCVFGNIQKNACWDFAEAKWNLKKAHDHVSLVNFLYVTTSGIIDIPDISQSDSRTYILRRINHHLLSSLRRMTIRRGSKNDKSSKQPILSFSCGMLQGPSTGRERVSHLLIHSIVVSGQSISFLLHDRRSDGRFRSVMNLGPFLASTILTSGSRKEGFEISTASIVVLAWPSIKRHHFLPLEASFEDRLCWGGWLIHDRSGQGYFFPMAFKFRTSLDEIVRWTHVCDMVHFDPFRSGSCCTIVWDRWRMDDGNIWKRQGCVSNSFRVGASMTHKDMKQDADCGRWRCSTCGDVSRYPRYSTVGQCCGRSPGLPTFFIWTLNDMITVHGPTCDLLQVDLAWFSLSTGWPKQLISVCAWRSGSDSKMQHVPKWGGEAFAIASPIPATWIVHPPSSSTLSFYFYYGRPWYCCQIETERTGHIPWGDTLGTGPSWLSEGID